MVAQYIAGAILLILVFLLLSDPQGTADVISSLASGNVSIITALQGRGAEGQPSRLQQRRSGRA